MIMRIVGVIDNHWKNMNNQPNCTPIKKLNWHPSKIWLLPRRWLHGRPEVWEHQKREAGEERRRGWIGTFLEKRDAQWLPAAVSRHSGATSGATSFIPTTATGRELGMAACSFVFSRQNYVSFSPKTNSNSWLKSSRLLDYITLLSVSFLFCISRKGVIT